MTVQLNLANDNKPVIYNNVWEVYDNSTGSDKELVLVNHDHLVLARIKENEITHLSVNL